MFNLQCAPQAKLDNMCAAKFKSLPEIKAGMAWKALQA